MQQSKQVITNKQFLKLRWILQNKNNQNWTNTKYA